MFPTPCVILAGGKSSRMGKDKALLPFGGYDSLTKFQYERLSPLFSSLHVSVKEDKFNSHMKLILDESECFSPMVALGKILSCFDGVHVFILSVDTPNVSQKEIEKLFLHVENYDIIIPKTPSHSHQLCGFYHSSLAPMCQELASKNVHKIRALFEHVKIKYVNFKDEKAFLNLNYFDEYERAKRNF